MRICVPAYSCVVELFLLQIKILGKSQIYTYIYMLYAKWLQSCPTLCDPIDGSPPGSPVPGILQARTLEWVAISFSNAWKQKVKVKLLSHVRLSDPMDCSPPGSSIHGIFQARVLEWGAIAFSIHIYIYIHACIYMCHCRLHIYIYIYIYTHI